jgi:hypothetical protein
MLFEREKIFGASMQLLNIEPRVGDVSIFINPLSTFGNASTISINRHLFVIVSSYINYQKANKK